MASRSLMMKFGLALAVGASAVALWCWWDARQTVSSTVGLTIEPAEVSVQSDDAEKPSEEFWIESLESSDPRVMVSALAETEKRVYDENSISRRYHAEVACQWDLAGGERLLAELTPRVREPSVRVVSSFRVVFERKPAFRASPGEVVIVGKTDWPLRREVVVTPAVPIDTTSVRLLCDPSWLQATLEPDDQETSEIRLSLQIAKPSGTSTGLIEGRVTLETADAEEPRISIPVLVDASARQ